MFARATKERFDALEDEREKLALALLQEEIRHPVLTEEKIRFWLRGFRSLDLALLEHRKRLVDSFVNSIHLYDDRIVVTFNYKDGAKTIMLADIPDDFGSDLESSLRPPSKSRKVLTRLTLRLLLFFCCSTVLGDFALSDHYFDHYGTHIAVFGGCFGGQERLGV